MKKILFVLVICMFSQIPNLKAQLQPGECGIMFTYDATGSLIQREFICNNSGTVMYRTANSTMKSNDSISTGNLSDEKIIKVNALMPNPTTGKFTITLSNNLKNGKVMLLDANGKIIENRTENGNSISFDVSSRSSGIYFIRIENEGEKFTFKVIKQ
ncbi:MAG: T9SS type A sorting domain-containing protein [Bacteroidota bacterium]|nr:T9SS type A sorting domain-containing protein [Bacteroidota bacterium]